MIQKISKNFLNVKITKRVHAFKGYVSTYNVEILNSFNPELKVKDTESTITSKLIKLWNRLRGIKFVKKAVLVFKKIESKDKTMYDNFYSSSKAETITNKTDIYNVFKLIYTAVITNIENSSLKYLEWFTELVIDHTISI